ncbi:MAG: MYG1 family protein [Parcubacteria group bacterium]|nr:MYG1 family protein [Parcubacteria group bacterium]
MNKVKIITHSASFHTDDVFAVATLQLFLKDALTEVIRTRDPEIIKTGDYVVDVGGIHDEKLKRFDHHQIGGAGERENKIPYASFGLVWKAYGEEICGSKTVAQEIDRKLVQYADAVDSAVDVSKSILPDVDPYFLHNIIHAFSPTWKEKDYDTLGAFNMLVELAKKLLEREIVVASHKEEGVAFVEEIYRKSTDKKLIVMDEVYPWFEVLSKYTEPLFVVYPNREDNTWSVKAVRKDPHYFENKKDFPIEWEGKRDKELADIVGVSDARFCHNKRFLTVAGSKEGAIAIAQIAIES